MFIVGFILGTFIAVVIHKAIEELAARHEQEYHRLLREKELSKKKEGSPKLKVVKDDEE